MGLGGFALLASVRLTGMLFWTRCECRHMEWPGTHSHDIQIVLARIISGPLPRTLQPCHSRLKWLVLCACRRIR